MPQQLKYGLFSLLAKHPQMPKQMIKFCDEIDALAAGSVNTGS